MKHIEAPSIVAGLVMVSNGAATVMVCTPDPAMLNWMVSLDPYAPVAVTSALMFMPALID